MPSSLGIDALIPTEYGYLLETFEVNEILRQASWSDEQYYFGHFRSSDHAEVDLVIESTDETVAGVEVKAPSTVNGADLRGLSMLKNKMGDKFIGGAVLYTGTRAYSYELSPIRYPN